MENNQQEEGLSGLPVLKKEKVMRFLTTYVIPGSIATVLVLTFMPYVNKALSLLVEGVWDFAELAFATGVSGAIIYAGISLWPAYQRYMESLANKATWAVFEYDPITPMELRIQEVERDDKALQLAYTNVDGVVGRNEQQIGELRQQSADARKRFGVAVEKYGPNSHQANMASIDVGTPKETADNIERDNSSLIVMRDMLKQICEASEFNLKQAKAQVAGAKVQWDAAQASENAFAKGFRVLRGKSERSVNADKAMQIVRNRFGSSFGRVRALRQLADQVLNDVDLQKGVFHDEALKQFRQETQLLTGKAPATIEITPVVQPARVSLYHRN